jgi:glycosyltransferase involved in cell wall biosynthesis
MSVIAQSNDVAIEILVGDDQSDDKTSEIIETLVIKYPQLIRYFRHSKRLGYGSKNYQALIRETRGSYIAHLDGDDYWLPGKLVAQVRFLERNMDCGAVYTNALAIDDNDMLIGLFNNYQSTRFDINDILSRGNFLNHSSLCYRSTLRQELLKMEAPFLDYRIHLNLACYGSIGYLNQVLVVYRVNSTSSVLVHANERIRRLYWETLLDVPIDAINTDALACSMAEFARSVFFRSLRIKKISLMHQWLPIVLKAAPIGKLKMLVLIFTAIFRVTIEEIISIICVKISKNPMKVLYRR